MVEDDDKGADLIRLLLAAEGFDVVRAGSAEEALAMAPLHDLSLVTVDIRLPGIDGWELVARLRDDPALTDVPVIVITGDPDADLALAAGATSILQKPVSRADLRASLAVEGLHEDQVATRTVLVVDDDPLAVEMIAAFLPHPAYAVVRAFGGAEAIELARRLHPDLMLLDLMMPEVSGLDVVEALRQDAETASIPILVVTAKHITGVDRASLFAHSSQVVHVVQKAGFDRETFLDEVRRALPPVDQTVVR